MTNCSSGPKASRRTPECTPSAPITRSNRPLQPALEPDLDAARGLGHRGDPIAEQVFGVLAGVAQDAGQVAAEHLEVAAGQPGRPLHQPLAALVDEAHRGAAGLDGPQPPELPATGWREALTGWAEALLARYQGHVWSLEATTGRRAVGPHEMGWMEGVLAVLPAGLTGAERLDVAATVAGHVRMVAGQADGGETALTAAIGVVLREHADRYPAVAAAVSDVIEHGGADRAFQFGLERILDGLEVLIRTRV